MTATLYALGAVTVDKYRLYTGDYTTAGPVVTGSLVEAEGILSELLRRDLAYDERAETVRIHGDGRVYPKAWPIRDAGGLTIEGRAVLGVTSTLDLTGFVAFLGECEPASASLTYSGGFDDGTNSRALPFTLAHALYDLARALAVDAPAGLVGALSASVGDVSVSRGEAGDGDAESLVPGISNRVRRYMNRWAA